MAETPPQTGPIAVYGATGYTGRLVAAELRRRGAEAVLAGRNRPKLEILAEDLGGGLAIQEASLDDSAALRELLDPCAAVIACAGPFRLHGEPVLAAAVETGTHYVDTTGEQPFMLKVFEDYGPSAEQARGGPGDGDGLRLRARGHARGAHRRGHGIARRDRARPMPCAASARPTAPRSRPWE